MGYYKELTTTVQDGINNKYHGIPFPLEKLNRDVPGIQKSRIYVTAGSTGSGKSKFLNENFLFTSFDDWIASEKAYNLHIYYFSLEIPKEQILAALALRWLFKRHGIITDNMYLLGYHKDVKPDKYIIELIHSDEFKVLMNDFESVVEIIDTSINYIKFDNFVLAKAREHGEIEYKEQVTTDGKKLKIFTKYIENDDKQRVLFIVDHIALVKTISGQSKKGMIDEMADIMIKARNRYRFSFGITQQLNRSFASTDRKKLEDMLPKDGDLKEGGGLAEAADVIFGLMSPYREKLNTFLGYRVSDTSNNKGLKGRMLMLNIVKNRHGTMGRVYPLLFLGELGLFSHLPPKPENFDYDILNKFTHYETL